MIPPSQNAKFVCRMEDVLALYHEPYGEDRPVVCFDETNKQLLTQIRDPLLGRPRAVARTDYTNRRAGTRNLFVISEPLVGWRHVDVTKKRTRVDSSSKCANLSTAWELEFHFTPPHGSRLNKAEIEFSVLASQCLDHRILDAAILRSEVVAWEQSRNEADSAIDCQFTTDDARIKLRRLYLVSIDG